MIFGQVKVLHLSAHRFIIPNFLCQAFFQVFDIHAVTCSDDNQSNEGVSYKIYCAIAGIILLFLGFGYYWFDCTIQDSLSAHLLIRIEESVSLYLSFLCFYRHDYLNTYKEIRNILKFWFQLWFYLSYDKITLNKAFTGYLLFILESAFTSVREYSPCPQFIAL